MEFVDYASVAVSGDRIAVVSQSSAAVWIGTMAAAGFGIVDGGMIYEFPATPPGGSSTATSKVWSGWVSSW